MDDAWTSTKIKIHGRPMSGRTGTCYLNMSSFDQETIYGKSKKKMTARDHANIGRFRMPPSASRIVHKKPAFARVSSDLKAVPAPWAVPYTQNLDRWCHRQIQMGARRSADAYPTRMLNVRILKLMHQEHCQYKDWLSFLEPAKLLFDAGFRETSRLNREPRIALGISQLNDSKCC